MCDHSVASHKFATWGVTLIPTTVLCGHGPEGANEARDEVPIIPKGGSKCLSIPLPDALQRIVIWVKTGISIPKTEDKAQIRRLMVINDQTKLIVKAGTNKDELFSEVWRLVTKLVVLMGISSGTYLGFNFPKPLKSEN